MLFVLDKAREVLLLAVAPLSIPIPELDAMVEEEEVILLDVAPVAS